MTRDCIEWNIFKVVSYNYIQIKKQKENESNFCSPWLCVLRPLWFCVMMLQKAHNFHHFLEKTVENFCFHLQLLSLHAWINKTENSKKCAYDGQYLSITSSLPCLHHDLIISCQQSTLGWGMGVPKHFNIRCDDCFHFIFNKFSYLIALSIKFFFDFSHH